MRPQPSATLPSLSLRQLMPRANQFLWTLHDLYGGPKSQALDHKFLNLPRKVISIRCDGIVMENTSFLRWPKECTIFPAESHYDFLFHTEENRHYLFWHYRLTPIARKEIPENLTLNLQIVD